MSNFSSMFMATVKPFVKDGELIKDCNNEQTIFLDVFGGRCPSKRVIAGTIAVNSGLEVGKTYLISCVETESNEYGRNFQFNPIKEVNAVEIVQSMGTIGQRQIIDVNVTVEATQQEEEKPILGDLPVK